MAEGGEAVMWLVKGGEARGENEHFEGREGAIPYYYCR